MIQGRSSFVFRLDIVNAYLDFDFPIYLSEEIVEKLKSEKSYFNSLKERIQTELNVNIESAKEDLNKEVRFLISKPHVDINLVENDILICFYIYQSLRYHSPQD